MFTWTPGVVDALATPDDTAPPFHAVLRPEGINVVVDVPARVSAWFAKDGPIPVIGMLDDVGIMATLMPAGGGHKLYLNREMRSKAGLAVGDEVEAILWWDPSPRRVVIPDDLAEALRGAGAYEAFTAWPPSHQREYILAIEDAKRPETRQRRIERTVGAALKPGEGGATGVEGQVAPGSAGYT